MARILAEEFSAAGHDITVVTQSNGAGKEEFSFVVVRRPTALHWAGILRRNEVVLHMNISLKAVLPNLLCRRPIVVSHQGWYQPRTVKRVRDRLKDKVTRKVTNVAASAAIARHLITASIVIPNTYDDSVFRIVNHGIRHGAAFVGRLVSDKGAALLLQAIGHLHRDGLKIPLSIVGDGPERARLEDLARSLGIEKSVRFLGSYSPREIAAVLNETEVLVVPSIWEEPFGIVALEGIACGCVVVASRGGGLSEAVGRCGLTVPNGDVLALANALRQALSDRVLRESLRNSASAHLTTFSRRSVANRYLSVLESAAAAGPHSGPLS